MGGITETWRELRALLRLDGFRKLFAVRLVSQAGDGMFQVGLASLLFFSPERAGTAPAIAGAFAVMLAPFTLVGPFAGVFLDRWRRRQVLAAGNAVRLVVAGAMATVMLTAGLAGVAEAWIIVLALVALSVNRFLLAGLSAGLPRVVDGPLLLTANSLTPTLGAGAAFLGGGVGFVIGLGIPAGPVHDAAALVCAALVFGAAAALALRLAPDQLGPEHPSRERLGAELAAVARGLADGARYLVRRRTPGQGLLVMAVHRFLYGVVFIASILISRNLLSAPGDTAGGLATFGLVIAMTGVGGACAVLVTPVLSRYTGPQAWIAIVLAGAGASQLLLLPQPTRTTVLLAAGLLGLAAQSAKIAVDTIVQRDTHDDYRGRAFAFYDVLYNAAFVGAATLATVVVPDDGWSPALFGGLAVAYVAVAAVMALRGARTPAHADVAPARTAGAASSGDR
ncbi:MFS transporter [Isoptericola variabilis]|uniref:Major facilitator superfamily MFS_1 n=1 Tax=Isoptericola variabilis (strain 225) TaxID=743718 RepID=F6FWP0_ISOV2|nr:MFS transporter [Isoptericola variabilis]AEG45681.1 major facilitator superfamily MFS_1 [Isoptericola variabilis 225]TWH33768.1 MFS transporter [Isoptericola variabilis J7]